MILTSRDKDQRTFDRLFEISNRSFPDIERPNSETFQAHFDADDVFVDEVESPTAYAIVTERGGPWLWSTAVISGLRHMGKGGRLIDEIISFYTGQNRGHIALTVRVDNVPAQILYLKKRFRPVRVMPAYYSSGVDGLMMRVTL